MHPTLNRLALLEVRLRTAEIREAVRHVVAKSFYRRREASVRHLTPEVLTAFAEGFCEQPHNVREAGIGDIVKKLSKLVKLFRRAPKLLERMKEFLGDLDPRTILKWAKDGVRAAGRKIQKAVKSWPLAMFFFPKSKLPSLSDMIANIVNGTRIGDLLKKVQSKAVSVDVWLEKHPIIKGMSKPVLAAAFIFIWINVSEISWDMESIFRGFTGQMPFSEVLTSLPESAIGLVFASMGIGYGFMGPVLMARIIWLVASNYVEYVPGRGFKVFWDVMGKYTPESGTFLDRTPDVQFFKWSPS